MITEHDPIMKALNDQFTPMFAGQDAELERMRKITSHLQAMQMPMKALGDGLRHPTDIELIDEALALGQRLNLLCGELKQKLPGEFDAALVESKDLLHDIQNNLAGIRMHYYYIVARKPVDPCTCGGECDSCVAARSDEHHDRKRDGLL